MKAIRCDRYGPPDVLRLEEVAKPTPKDSQVLIRVRAASLNPLDWHFMRGTPYLVRAMTGWRKPKVGHLGVDVAGTVEAVGKDVTQFKPGDEVFGAGNGALAEYACAAAHLVVVKPANVTFEQAAAVPIAAITALQALRDKGRIQPGQKVLINGAAGGVGTFAVQIAKHFGAEATGVCGSRNMEMVRSLGANHVVDYAQEDFTRSGRRYDLIVDSVGNHSLSDLRRAMTAKGALVMVGGSERGHLFGPLIDVVKVMVASWFVKQRLLPFLARMNQADLIVMQELLEEGKVRAVIDRTYPLSEVPEAIRYLEEGHARGKVIITT